MLYESATDAKNQFGAVVDAALREPVVIQRSGRNTVVMLAYEEYEEMLRISDAYWGERAKRAKKKGMLSAAESRAFLQSLIHA